MANELTHHIYDEDNKVGAKNGQDGANGFVKFGKPNDAIIGFKNKKEDGTKCGDNQRITKKTAISRNYNNIKIF